MKKKTSTRKSKLELPVPDAPARAEFGRGPWNTVEVADITAIPRMTINRWIASSKIRAPRKDPKSQEFLWTQADVDELIRYSQSQNKVDE